MMMKAKTEDKRIRISVTLDEGTHGMLTQASEYSGVPVAGIVTRFLGAHMEELGDWLDVVEQLPDDPRARAIAHNMLASYGPETLTQAIKRLAPNFRTASERFVDSVNATLTTKGDN